MQNTLLGEEMEQQYSVFKFKIERDWAGRRAYLGRQPVVIVTKEHLQKSFFCYNPFLKYHYASQNWKYNYLATILVVRVNSHV